MWTGNSRIMKPPNKWIQAITLQPVFNKIAVQISAETHYIEKHLVVFLHPTGKYWNCALNFGTTTLLPVITKSFNTIQPEILTVSLNRLYIYIYMYKNTRAIENMFIHA
jgi:hypothetical protein